MKSILFFVIIVASLVIGAVIREQKSNLNVSVESPFKTYFLQNRMQQCEFRPEQPRMPRSYFVKPGYFDSVPPSNRVPPHRPNKPAYLEMCGREVSVEEQNAYEFETEIFLTSLGLNIYDGTIFSIALAQLGEVDQARDYTEQIIYKGQTCQFSNIRADAPCKGILGKTCEDPDHTGSCGFCYGDTTQKSLDRKNAWSFRMISDYWALMNTVDLRCPEKEYLWTWNDYKPILGENSWAGLVAPLQLAYAKFGSVSAIPDNDIGIQMAIDFLPSLDSMLTPVGAVYYSPRNVLGYGNADVGDDISTENNISLLAGLKMLRFILTKKNIHMDKMALVNKLIDNITRYLKDTYDPVNNYFRQGGKYDPVKGFRWATGDALFAVDCQTWLMTVINPLLIDQWYGAGTAIKVWNTTKALGGYKYNRQTGWAEGVGFSINAVDQVFSGEWTLGGINMLRVFSKAFNDASFNHEADYMRAAITRELYTEDIIDGVKTRGVLYANKRYFIPFGWWANPLMSSASTGWTVLVDSAFNPFYLGGQYLSDY